MYGPVCVAMGGCPSRFRQVVDHRAGRLASIRHSRIARRKAVMRSMVMHWATSEFEDLPPSGRCNIVDIAKVPQDYGGRRASGGTANLGSRW